MPPTPTPRGTPAGLPLDDGQSTLITFASNPTIMFWGKSVTPPGMDNGPPIDVTTMHNKYRRTKAPHTINDVTDGGAKVAYDPAVITQIDALVGTEDTITFTYPNGDTDCDFGYLKSFKRDPLEEGKQPEATIEIVFTGRDPLTNVENPSIVFTPKTGT